MAIELVSEALPGDLCHEKFDQEMDTVDLVDVSVSVKSEEDTIPTGKKRGRPKKNESPDGKTIRTSNKYHCQ